jgi:hypothetical protein
VAWRDGVHLTGTPIWCDARRRRDVCFLSSADRVGRTGHGQLIGTAITLALADASGPGHLAVPLRQRFTLGTVRLELIPSGRGFGAAALHADVTGKTVLYAGAVRTSTGGVGDAAELRACDAVVVAAPYGESHHRFPPLAGAIAAAIDWTRAQLAAGRRPVLVVDSVLDGPRPSRLAAETIPIAGGRAAPAAHRIAELVPPPQLVDGESRSASRSYGAPGLVSLRSTRGEPPRPPRSRRRRRPARRRPGGGSQTFPRPALDATSGVPRRPAGRSARDLLDADRAARRALGDRPAATALVSARAMGAAGCDARFAWASADRAQLLTWSRPPANARRSRGRRGRRCDRRARLARGRGRDRPAASDAAVPARRASIRPARHPPRRDRQARPPGWP